MIKLSLVACSYNRLHERWFGRVVAGLSTGKVTPALLPHRKTGRLGRKSARPLPCAEVIVQAETDWS